MSNTHFILATCRSGYESDLAAEMVAKATELGVYGYVQTTKGTGSVHYHCTSENDLNKLSRQLRIDDVVFARQMFTHLVTIDPLPASQRVEAVLAALLPHADALPKPLGQVLVEHPDTDSGHEVAKFCRKFAVPLRQALRKAKLLSAKETSSQSRLHIFMPSFEQLFIGVSTAAQSHPQNNGIRRLKFPSAAPSRSTLKLEEAILELLTESQRQQLFREGARAVDLGACPGGWTYQLVSRGMHVEAVDNGAMAESLMATGQVSYFAADGFKYKPEYGRAQLLVCDMIERPDRVAALMQKWLQVGYTDAAIFNLKLPMKKRYETVAELLKQLTVALASQYSIVCKQLYHNRDEVTVAIMPKA
ncbi:23S rRNA (cytidine(2498)-2'-O)-methyltransferase RlmM [Alteromonas sp. ASW11-36]|uniref:23S rRNA (Cytidine(2498)-2'-O)-methyltransferase RlmM n=1 Tax=Alteromonas arenosi TaxID=3055817 RepID=A0ABT7SYC6_9ALTE|nr:23S rRNA (cytidine(2498)-2'-O)-methyltransferase RlmM [Alteromonas sp. ASW11-36]MDM7861181.1 23S rRNA (cytidine(2498)-2'-O)-methyltransferase RlmM [Alteromonas sp. ASW11-36]